MKLNKLLLGLLLVPTLMNAASGGRDTVKVEIQRSMHEVSPEVAHYITRLKEDIQKERRLNRDMGDCLKSYGNKLEEVQTINEKLAISVLTLKESIKQNDNHIAILNQQLMKLAEKRDPRSTHGKKSPLARVAILSETRYHRESSAPDLFAIAGRSKSAQPFVTKTELQDEIVALKSIIQDLQSEIKTLKTPKASRLEIAKPQASRPQARRRSKSVSRPPSFGAKGATAITEEEEEEEEE